MCFLLASISEVYNDPQVQPQPESYYGFVNPVDVRGVYDEAKRFVEAMTMAYHTYHDVETRIVPIFNIFGPRMRLYDGCVMHNFIAQALHGEPFTLYGDGMQTRSFQYVSDLVEGIYRLLHFDEVNPVNIGNPGEFTIKEFAEIVNKLTDNKVGTVTKDLYTQDDPQVRQPDITRAKTILGWEPQMTLRQGIECTFPWFRDELTRRGELSSGRCL